MRARLLGLWFESRRGHGRSSSLVFVVCCVYSGLCAVRSVLPAVCVSGNMNSEAACARGGLLCQDC